VNLVDGNADVYRQLLAEPAAKRLYLSPLVGRPTSKWAPLAILALEKGFTPHVIQDAAEGTTAWWSGLESAHWESWQRDWENLLHDSPELRAVAEIGIDRARARRDGCLQKEADERIYGR
jgi:hypothetical protein